MRKATAILLSAIILMSFVACDSKGTNVSQDGTSQKAQVQSESTQAEPIVKLKSEDFPLSSVRKVGNLNIEDNSVENKSYSNDILDKMLACSKLSDGIGFYKFKVISDPVINNKNVRCKVQIEYDYFNDKIINDYNYMYTVFFSGDLNLIKGMEYASFLVRCDNKYECEPWFFPFYDVYNINNHDIAFSKVGAIKEMEEIDLGLLDNELYIINSDASKKIYYYQKFEINQLVDFFKEKGFKGTSYTAYSDYVIPEAKKVLKQKNYKSAFDIPEFYKYNEEDLFRNIKCKSEYFSDTDVVTIQIRPSNDKFSMYASYKYYIKDYDLSNEYFTLELNENNIGLSQNDIFLEASYSVIYKFINNEVIDVNFDCDMLYYCITIETPYDGTYGFSKIVCIEDEKGLIPEEVDMGDEYKTTEKNTVLLKTDKKVYSLKDIQDGNDRINLYMYSTYDEPICYTYYDWDVMCLVNNKWEKNGKNCPDPTPTSIFPSKRIWNFWYISDMYLETMPSLTGKMKFTLNYNDKIYETEFEVIE